MPPKRNPLATAGICAALAALVFMVFGQTIGFGFVNRDDSDYISNNPIVLDGVSLADVELAFTHVVSQHWHPLTVIVLMLAHQAFGMWPGGYHLLNVALHAACAVLLFLFLLELTGALWRSAFVAAVFAIHPLRAESVAWISECKDVLSGVFFILTLWAYVRYARQPRASRYAALLLWFALGLMSKPMLITVPCVLLLLDYWPLGRLRSLSQLPGLLWEKAPLFLLSLLSGIATVVALKSASSPASSHLAIAPIAYVAYLRLLLYPVRLATLYPLPLGGVPPWEAFDAALALAALTAGAYILRRKQPVLLTGWLWYLGMLVPVAGVIQTGNQAYADHYTYLPQIGLCIAGTWTVADWARNQRHGRAIVGSMAAVILCVLTIACWRQTGYWRDSRTLWTHAIESTDDNVVAHTNLAEILSGQGHIDEAIDEYREAISLHSDSPEARTNLGALLIQQGHIDEAIDDYRQLLLLRPDAAEPHFNLGTALFLQGRTEEAIGQFNEAVRLNPNDADFHNNLGNALFKQGRAAETIAEYREAVRLRPAFVEAHNNLGYVLLQQGEIGEAVAEFREALQIDPTYSEARKNLDGALLRQGRAGQ